MPRIVAEQQKEVPILPEESILFLVVEGSKVEEKQGRNGPWQKLDITFKITGVQAVGGGGDPSAYDNLIGENIWGAIPFRLTDHPENKLKLWAEAILQVPIGEGFELETDYFNGRPVRGVVSTFEKTRAGLNPVTGQPFIGHQISALLRVDSSPQQALNGQNGFSFNNPPQAQQTQQYLPSQQPQQQYQPPQGTPPQQQQQASPWQQAQVQQGGQQPTQQGTLLDDEPPF